MRSCLTAFYVFLFLVFTIEKGICGSIVVYRIDSLKEIEGVVDELIADKLSPNKIVLASDWDQVISLKNGTNLPTREKDTIATIQRIQMKGVNFLVLTSRGSGREDMVPHLSETAEKMNRDLKEFANSNSSPLRLRPALKSQEFFRFKGPTIHTHEDYKLTFPRSPVKSNPSPSKKYPAFVASHNIAFAGNPEHENMQDSSLKALALSVLIDDGHLVEKPEYILFVDNDYEHIQGMMKAFEKRHEKAILFWYPDEQDIMSYELVSHNGMPTSAFEQVPMTHSSSVSSADGITPPRDGADTTLLLKSSFFAKIEKKPNVTAAQLDFTADPVLDSVSNEGLELGLPDLAGEPRLKKRKRTNDR